LFKSNKWENGELAKIKVINENKCLGNFRYYKDGKDGISKILTGINLPLVDCEKGQIFRKIGNKLNLVYLNDDEKLNECLVYNKPNIIGWKQCDEEGLCKSKKAIYDKGDDYMDCMDFEFIKDITTNMYKIKIKGKNNKCLQYLKNSYWGEKDCNDNVTLYNFLPITHKIISLN
jgi:hypothetical protein